MATHTDAHCRMLENDDEDKMELDGDELDPEAPPPWRLKIWSNKNPLVLIKLPKVFGSEETFEIKVLNVLNEYVFEATLANIQWLVNFMSSDPAVLAA